MLFRAARRRQGLSRRRRVLRTSVPLWGPIHFISAPLQLLLRRKNQQEWVRRSLYENLNPVPSVTHWVLNKQFRRNPWTEWSQYHLRRNLELQKRKTIINHPSRCETPSCLRPRTSPSKLSRPSRKPLRPIAGMSRHKGRRRWIDCCRSRAINASKRCRSQKNDQKFRRWTKSHLRKTRSWRLTPSSASQKMTKNQKKKRRQSPK